MQGYTSGQIAALPQEPQGAPGADPVAPAFCCCGSWSRPFPAEKRLPQRARGIPREDVVRVEHEVAPSKPPDSLRRCAAAENPGHSPYPRSHD